MRRCTVYNNTNRGSAYINGGRVENCLFYENAGNSGGGSVRLLAGELVNCTIADNTSVGSGALYRTGGTVINCIISGNTGGLNYAGAVSAVTYSCAPELTSGTGNITAGPQFTDAANDDYSILASSPCMETGTDAGLTDDILGNVRPQDGDNVGGAQHDMGAYERAAPPLPPFTIGFTADVEAGTEPLLVTFTATPGGQNPTVATYAWDFDNDGTIDSTAGPVVSTTYSGGLYTVKLTATNTDVPAEVESLTRTDYITVYSSTPHVYVSHTGSDTFPYDTWATATPSPNDAMTAVNGSGYTVHVAADGGVPYTVTAGIVLDGVIPNTTVIGEDGADVTTIQSAGAGNTYSLFTLADPGASVSGLTLTHNAGGTPTGSAVNMSSGTLNDCIISGCWLDNNSFGFLYMSGGLAFNIQVTDNARRYHFVRLEGTAVLEDSQIYANVGSFFSSYLYLAGSAIARRCEITSNISGSTDSPAPGGSRIVWQNQSSRLENCLVADNSHRGGRATVDMNGGTILNCTIAGNDIGATWSAVDAAGVDQAAGSILNTIIFGNTDNGAAATQYNATGGTATYSLAPELTSGTGNLTGDPLFVDAGTGDYHLQAAASPAVDAGLNGAWTPTDIDLDGELRIQSASVDMGAFEAPPVCDCPALTAAVVDALCTEFSTNGGPTTTAAGAQAVDAAIAAAFNAAGCPLDDPCADAIRTALGL